MEHLAGLSLEDIKAIAADKTVRAQTVNRLVEAGIPVDDVEGILDLRESLAQYSWIQIDARRQLTAQPSIEAMIRAYRTVEGDMNLLEEVVEYILDSSNIRARSHHEALDAALFQGLDTYQAGKLDTLQLDYPYLPMLEEVEDSD